MQHVAQIADTVAGKVTTHDYTLLFGNIEDLYDFNRYNTRTAAVSPVTDCMENTYLVVLLRLLVTPQPPQPHLISDDGLE